MFTQTDNFIDVLVKNSFIYFQQLELPLDFSSTKPYKVSNLPIINGIIPALLGDRTLIQNLQRKSSIPICCIVDCAAATCASNLKIADEIGKNIPLAFFGGEEVPKYLGVETCNTSLCFSLTK
ncbi:hypothetical protein II654_02035 [bacterium]|nr:hypothetical protein [bacterium]